MNAFPDRREAVPQISVALCTYNGARHLPAQLASIAAQTLLPDELIVSDDGSTDETAGVVEHFARDAPFPVRFYRQSANLGVTQNFGFALAACRGELVACCDQDDVWLPDKLSVYTRYLAAHPECLALFSDATVVDDDLRPVENPPSLWRHYGLTPEDRRRLLDPAGALLTLASRYLVTGATLMVRRALLDRALPIPARLPDKIIHDGWLALVAAALGGLHALPQPTMLYRQHAGQQLGIRADSTAPPRVGARAGYGVLAASLESVHAALSAQPGLLDAARGALDGLGRRAAFFRRRERLPAARGKRLRPVLADLTQGDYHRFCRRPLAAALRDLVS